MRLLAMKLAEVPGHQFLHKRTTKRQEECVYMKIAQVLFAGYESGTTILYIATCPQEGQ